MSEAPLPTRRSRCRSSKKKAVIFHATARRASELSSDTNRVVKKPCPKIIWPAQVGPDPGRVTEAVERANMVVTLAELGGEPSARGRLMIDLPLIDLTDRQVVDLADDLGGDRRPRQVRRTDLRLAIPVGVAHEQDAVELDLLGPLADLAQIDVHDVPRRHFDLRSAVLDDGVHAAPSFPAKG